jgi:hypothetical protein
MNTLTPDALAAAERFLALNARVLERRRFDHLFRGGPAEPVRRALTAYANPDGGYGHGYEPDLRGPSSQPVPLQHVLELAIELGDPPPAGLLGFLTSITTPDGGVPFVLPTIRGEPCGPWWVTTDDPPAAINPTATLTGLLYALGSTHPWLGPATAYCWAHVESLTETTPYDARAILRFLDHVPDRERAEKAFTAIREPILATATLDPDTPGEAHFPLDYAPAPDGFGRRLFTSDVIDTHLDALIAAQRPDGGWTVNWTLWTPIVEPEWRSWITLDRLTTLRAYGRLA